MDYEFKPHGFTATSTTRQHQSAIHLHGGTVPVEARRHETRIANASLSEPCCHAPARVRTSKRSTSGSNLRCRSDASTDDATCASPFRRTSAHATRQSLRPIAIYSRRSRTPGYHDLCVPNVRKIRGTAVQRVRSHEIVIPAPAHPLGPDNSTRNSRHRNPESSRSATQQVLGAARPGRERPCRPDLISSVR